MEAGPAAWMRIAIEIVACVIMLGGVLGVFIERFRTKRAKNCDAHRSDCGLYIVWNREG